MDDIPATVVRPVDRDTTGGSLPGKVWGLYGPWQDREAAITRDNMRNAHPEIVVRDRVMCVKAPATASARLADPLGLTAPAVSGRQAKEDEADMSAWP